MFVTAKVTGASVTAVLGRAKRIRFAVSQAVGKALADVQREHKTKQIKSKGNRRDKPVPGKWTTREGMLRRSFHIDWSPGETSGAYGSDLERARVIERGGVIKPTRGKYLAIPTENAPRSVWPRHVPGLHFHMSAKGNPLLVEGYGASMRVMYVLKRSVKLPPRPALDRAIKETEASRQKRFMDVLDALVK